MSGKETMYNQRKVNRWRAAAAVIVLGVAICILPGCTRREQLVLEVEDKSGLIEKTGQEILPDTDTADKTERTVQSRTEEGSKQEETGAGTRKQNVQNPEESDGQTAQIPLKEQEMICVHVCGAVCSAGVYELPAGSRVYEAVEKAGGFTDEADESYVNQAQRLSDGAKLVIPTAQQVQDMKDGGGSSTLQIGIVEQPVTGGSEGDNMDVGQSPDSDAPASMSDGKININTASEAQLCEIPGIGATRAAAIVAYRQESGSFLSIEDIMNVSGIKEGTFAKIKDRIKVN